LDARSFSARQAADRDTSGRSSAIAALFHPAPLTVNVKPSCDDDDRTAPQINALAANSKFLACVRKRLRTCLDTK
jgi:hypothetical protein